MSETFACPCLNVTITGKALDASATRIKIDKEAGLKAEHPFLAHASFSSGDSKGGVTLRCLNCQTDVAHYKVGSPAEDPYTLPVDFQVRLDPSCLRGEAIGVARSHQTHSHAFNVLMEPPNAPAPHLSHSPESTSLPMPPTSTTGTSPSASPIQPRHTQSDPSSSLNARLSQTVRIHRAETDRQVAELRRKSEAYARRAAKEADILAARAGVQRGGFTQTSISARAQSPKIRQEPSGPPVEASPNTSRRESIATTPSNPRETVSPTRAVQIAPNQATKSKQEDALKNKYAPSPYPVPVVRPSVPQTNSANASRSHSPTPEGKRERKVTFVEPKPIVHQPVVDDLATSASEGADTEDGDDMFELDEEMPEQSQSDESDTDGLDAPETPRVSSPKAAHNGTALVSPKDFDASKAAQARQLRDLLAVDLPSHRSSGRRRASQLEEEETESDSLSLSTDTESASDGPSLSRYASSVPVDIDLMHPRATGTVADVGALSPPGGNKAPAAAVFATSLREATEKALANAGSSAMPLKVTTATSNASEPMAFAKSPVEEHHVASSFRGPSSLTSALMRAPAVPPSNARQGLTSVDEASSTNAEVATDDEDDETRFIPPHVLARTRRGDEGLLSTSVRDLYE